LSKTPKKIAIHINSRGGWAGGEIYLRNIFLSLLEFKKISPLQIVLITDDVSELTKRDAIYLEADKIFSLPKNFFFGSFGAIYRYIFLAYWLRKNKVDGLYPIESVFLHLLGVKGASWIPDFQHIHLPHLFSKREIEKRNQNVSRLSYFASDIVLSSRNALHDFNSLYPRSKARPHLLNFFSFPDDGLWGLDPDVVKKDYALPQHYFLCSGQFWAHKNQDLILDALALLKAEGILFCVVFTGHLYDYRNPNYVDNFFSALHRKGLHQEIIVLGLIPRLHQLALMRGCCAVLQPSLFEGWSTVVEDARVLGKKIVLSDIPVHLEQSPELAIYFDRNSAHDLAEALKKAFSHSIIPQIVSSDEEIKSRIKAIKLVYAKKILEILA
jgi:glycosyltransferase involved in cell wall biosynthesis